MRGRMLTGGALVWLLALLIQPGFLAPDTARAQVVIREFTLGMSEQGRSIDVIQIGSGPRKLVVVGDTHGGPEANTYRLTLELIQYFHNNPDAVPPDVRLYLIPSINPDGLALDHRFDSQWVDLNRNMNTNLDACPENDWQPTVYGAYGVVSDTAGPYPDSQRESRLIRDFLLDASGVIFLHSNAGLVFPAYCEHAPSIQMAQVYAEAAGYIYNRFWPNYMIHGSMADWASSMGIAAITPELLSATSSEFDQNLAAMQAVLAQPESLLPLPADQVENGFVVPALIWRYWRSHGGEATFGLPLEPARTTDYGMAQTFTRARLELRPELADTPFLVQPAPLGQARLGYARNVQYAISHSSNQAPSEQEQPHYLQKPVAPSAPSVFFEETGYGMSEAFLNYWRRMGGVEVFGYPISEEFTMRTVDGQMRPVQYFEQAIFAYYPEDGSVRPEPLGWQQLRIEGVQQPWLHHQVR